MNVGESGPRAAAPGESGLGVDMETRPYAAPDSDPPYGTSSAFSTASVLKIGGEPISGTEESRR